MSAIRKRREKQTMRSIFKTICAVQHLQYFSFCSCESQQLHHVQFCFVFSQPESQPRDKKKKKTFNRSTIQLIVEFHKLDRNLSFCYNLHCFLLLPKTYHILEFTWTPSLKTVNHPVQQRLPSFGSFSQTRQNYRITVWCLLWPGCHCQFVVPVVLNLVWREGVQPLSHWDCKTNMPGWGYQDLKCP